MAGESAFGGGRLLGTNDLQTTIDKFNTAVNTLTTTVANMSSTSGGGMVTSPARSAASEGATFTQGAFPTMGAWANKAATIGGGGTLGQMAAGGGANGGGASFGTPSGNYASSAGPSMQNGTFSPSMARLPQGALPQGQYNSPAGPTMANGNFSTGPQGIIGGTGSGGGGPTFGQTAVAAAGQFTGWAMASGTSQLSNMLMYNAYGQQMTAQWGGSAQTYQNQAFGNGANGVVNNSAMGSPSSAAAEFGTLTQMAGGANVTGTSAFGATNALAFANQGLGAAGAAQVAAQIYSPTSSLQMQMLTGVSAINQQTGKQNSLSSIIGGLAGQGYLGGGSYNSKTGTFNQSALNASFTAGRGTSYMNLQSLGYSQSQIQDIQSVMSQANKGALAGHTTMQNVLNTINEAQYGSEGGTNNANSQLAKWGIHLSTVQKQGNQSSENMSQQQSESSTYNQSVSDFTSAMTKATNALNWFLDKTGLGKAIGGVQGAGAGYSSSGMSTWASGISKVASAVAGAFATGGVVPGYSPGVDNHTIAVSGGEGILTPEATRALGGETFVNSVNRQYAGYRGGGSGGGGRHFADGGVVTSGGDSSLGLTTDGDSTVFSVMAMGGGGGTLTNNSASGSGSSGSSGGGSGIGALGPAANVTAGSSQQNGRAVYNYLKDHLFGGSKIAAAGAIASIYGESTWNPEAVENPGNPGAGGEGLIQWTPGSKYGVPITGNASSDLSKQLPMIISFVNSSADMGTIDKMKKAKTVADAANLWGTGVERYGVDDVHAMGVQLAGQIAGLGKGQLGMATGGPIMVGERGPELFVPQTSGNLLNASQTTSLLRGTSAQPGQAPYTASPSQNLLYDMLSPANNAARQGNGGITVTMGDINVNAPNMTGNQTTSDVQVLGQLVVKQVEEAMNRSELIRNVANGVT
jgi:hypothetical protein